MIVRDRDRDCDRDGHAGHYQVVCKMLQRVVPDSLRNVTKGIPR